MPYLSSSITVTQYLNLFCEIWSQIYLFEPFSALHIVQNDTHFELTLFESYSMYFLWLIFLSLKSVVRLWCSRCKVYLSKWVSRGSSICLTDCLRRKCSSRDTYIRQRQYPWWQDDVFQRLHERSIVCFSWDAAVQSLKDNRHSHL